MINSQSMTGPSSQTWMRFGVCDSVGHWAPTWKLWRDDEDPRRFFLGSRCIAGRYSFVKTDDDRWRRDFTAGLRGNANPAPVPGVRVAFPTTAPGPATHGLVELMRVHTEPRAVCEPGLHGRYRFVARVPIHLGQANEISVLAVDRGTTHGTWPTQALGGTILLSSVELAAELRILIVYRSVLLTGVVERSEWSGRSLWRRRPSSARNSA